MSCPRTHLASLPACYSHYPYVLSTKQVSCEYHFFKVFWYDLTWEMNPRSTDCEADAVTTIPSRWSGMANKVIMSKAELAVKEEVELGKEE